MEASRTESLYPPVPPPASQGTVAETRPQEQDIVTGNSHLTSGQGEEGWQIAVQVCLQSFLGAPHVCLQDAFEPELVSAEASHGGGWQVLEHAWKPHCLVFPHSLLHLISFDPQGMLRRTTCPPTHSLAIGTVHGGQSPKWQL